MKRLLITLTAGILLFGTSMVHAGGYGGYYSGYHGGYHGGHISGHYGYRGSGRAANYLLGGLILGGIISYAFSHPHRRDYHGHRYSSRGHYSHRNSHRGNYSASDTYTVHRKVVRKPYYKTYSRRPVLAQQSHLHKDRYGNCFRIRYGEQGEELRTEQPRSVCDW